MSTVVRRFTDVDDMTFGPGVGGVGSTGYGTVALLVRPLATYDSTVRMLLTRHDSVDTLMGHVSVTSGNEVAWVNEVSGITSTGPGLTAGDWHLIVVRKADGVATPRFSVLNLATSIWSHAAGSNTVGNWTGASAGVAHLNQPPGNLVGPGSDYIAAAIWTNSLPFAADTFGDADIEALETDLITHLDNWKALEPTAGWAFGVTDINVSTEDFTLNRADEISVGDGSVEVATDITFLYETTGAETVSRNHLENSQTEPGTGGIVFDLDETQGTPTTMGSGSTSSVSFVEMLRWHRVVGVDVGSALFPTQVECTAVSSSQLRYRWRVQRYDSSGVLQASSDYSAEHNTTGIKTGTLVMDTTWSEGDRLALSLELRKAGGGGNRSITVAVNDADSWVDFDVAVASQGIAPAAIAVTSAPGAVTLSVGAVDITPAARTVTVTPAALALAVAISPDAVTATATPGTLTLTAGAVDITPAPRAVSVSPGALSAVLSGLMLTGPAVAASAGSLSVTAGAVDIVPAAVALQATAGSMSAVQHVTAASGTITATPGGLTVADTYGGMIPAAVSVSVTAGTLVVAGGGFMPGTHIASSGPGGLTATAPGSTLSGR